MSTAMFRIVGTCSRCDHDCLVGVTPSTAPAWLFTCPCDCHTNWRLWHMVTGDEPAEVTP